MDQLDQIWFQIKRKIQFKLTCCDILKISAEFRITPSHFTQNQTMQGENDPNDIFKTTYSNSEWFPMRGLDQVWQMSYFVYVWTNQG